MAADSLDVEWMLYQAAAKNVMTESEADASHAWFDQRPTVEEAPELLDYLPAQIYPPSVSANSRLIQRRQPLVPEHVVPENA